MVFPWSLIRIRLPLHLLILIEPFLNFRKQLPAAGFDDGQPSG